MTHVSIIWQAIVYVDTTETSWIKMEIIGCLKAFTYRKKYQKCFAFEASRSYLHFKVVIGVCPNGNYIEKTIE